MTLQLKLRVEHLLNRHHEVGLMLAEPDAANNSAHLRELSREYAQARELPAAFAESQKAGAELAHVRTMVDDPDLRDLARQEVARLEHAGGGEAAFFASDLLPMYLPLQPHRATAGEIHLLRRVRPSSQHLHRYPDAAHDKRSSETNFLESGQSSQAVSGRLLPVNVD